MVHLTATTGMSRSEVLGLKWETADLKAGAVEVNAEMVRRGMAWAYIEYSRDYVRLEAEARAWGMLNCRGQWLAEYTYEEDFERIRKQLGLE